MILRYARPNISAHAHTTLASRQSVRPGHSRPNIVFVLADDLGSNDLSYDWNPRSPVEQIPTPHIDSLARKEGTVRLRNCYAMPMCTPTRAALLSGRHPILTGLHHFVLLSSQPTGLPLSIHDTLPTRLKAVGYATHMVGKWHLGFCKRAYFPTNRGFDTFLGYVGGAQDYWTHDTDEWLEGPREIPRRLTSGVIGHDYFRNDQPLKRQQVDGQHGSYLIQKEVSTVIAMHAASNRARERASLDSSPDSDPEEDPSPLFMYVASQAPHAHFTGVPDHVAARLEDTRLIGGDPTRLRFAGLVLCLDDLVGSIVETLVHHDLWQNTVFIFASDNGPEPMTGGSSYPYRGKKRTLWEGGIRSHAFIHSPSLLPTPTGGRDYTGLMHFSDWAATLMSVALTAADSPPPPPSSERMRKSKSLSDLASEDSMAMLNGVDQWEAIRKGNGETPRLAVLLNYDQVFNCGALRWGRYKLVWNGNCGAPAHLHDGWEEDGYERGKESGMGTSDVNLFDLDSDPTEEKDLSVDPFMYALLNEMKTALDAFGTHASEPLAWTTHGDPQASPDLHDGNWVPWLEPEYRPQQQQ